MREKRGRRAVTLAAEFKQTIRTMPWEPSEQWIVVIDATTDEGMDYGCTHDRGRELLVALRGLTWQRQQRLRCERCLENDKVLLRVMPKSRTLQEENVKSRYHDVRSGISSVSSCYLVPNQINWVLEDLRLGQMDDIQQWRSCDRELEILQGWSAQRERLEQRFGHRQYKGGQKRDDW